MQGGGQRSRDAFLADWIVGEVAWILWFEEERDPRPTTSNGMSHSRTEGRRKAYRIVVGIILGMAAVMAVMMVANWRYGMLSVKATQLVTFGSFFLPLVAFGYWSEQRARDAEE